MHVQIESEAEGMVCFDARLSREHPTVELRVADVCLAADDVVLVAALGRALVETAARSGLDGDLLDPAGRPAPAFQVIRKLVGHVRPVLHDQCELDIVEDLVAAVLKRGNGATAQRHIYRTSGQLADVVTYAVKCTIL